ncbi:MAG: TolC family protein [Oligoflexia bacterium]|nr:TolC family protein [Oligoflexia bacterium]
MRSSSRFLCLSLLLAVSLEAQGASLSIEDFLEQVRARNGGVAASLEASAGARARAGEGALLTTTSAFATLQLASDGKPTLFPAQQGEKTLNNSLALGVSRQLSFGLAAKLSYNASFTEIQGSQAISALYPQGFKEARPVLELSQPLLRNGFGRELRATQELIETQALAQSHAESFKAKVGLAEAESAYWRLAAARKAVQIQSASLARALKIRDWNKRRVELHLADRTDLLQAEAGVQVRQLELQGARDEERAAAYAFNSARGAQESEVVEELEAMDPKRILAMKAPVRGQYREDVEAARQQSLAQKAGARIGAEKNLPSLDLYASVALNGRDSSLGTAVSNSLSAANPTTAIGIKMTAPLDFELLESNRAGYRREEAAAEQALSRKVYEQERDWADLQEGLIEGRRRLELFLAMEKVQEAKLAAERDRHDRGRSTTYQVLLFEQDYAQAQLGRLQAETMILRLLARMKTFRGES